jgi:amino acid transporter
LGTRRDPESTSDRRTGQGPIEAHGAAAALPDDAAGQPSDSAVLRDIGYEQTLKREFGFWSAFAVGFADISPIVGMYGMYALALAAAGPLFWWGFWPVLAGQILVALVFGEIASKWPVAGGVYQWTRCQVGKRVAWFAGWSYLWTLTIATAALALGAASFLAPVLGLDQAGYRSLLLLSLVILVFGSLMNSLAQWALKLFMALSIGAEIIASGVMSTVLLLFYREQPVSVLFQGVDGMSGFELLGPWLGAVAFVGYSFVGFEASGAIAEEVRRPARAVPRAIIFALVTVAVVIMYSALAVTLAIPDLDVAMSGNVADPVAATLQYHFGAALTKPVLVMIAIGFTASMVAVQTAVSRTVFSLARDQMLPGSGWLRGLREGSHLPARAIAVVASISAAFLLISSTNVYQTLVSFTTFGFYVSFAFPVMAALAVRLHGRWRPGEFTLGRSGTAITLLASSWLVFECINVAWPRFDDLPWYQNYGVILMAVILAILGTVLHPLGPWRKAARGQEDEAKAEATG